MTVTIMEKNSRKVNALNVAIVTQNPPLLPNNPKALEAINEFSSPSNVISSKKM